jgi:hypothetical protein
MNAGPNLGLAIVLGIIGWVAVIAAIVVIR